MEIYKRIMGIDYGSKRIGIAISDPLNIIAQGVGVIENNNKKFDEIEKLVAENNVNKIVVGLPLELKGQKGQSARDAEQFTQELEEKLSVQVFLLDERFTSALAHQTLRNMNVRKRERQSKERIDIMSAAIILQNYLDMMNSSKK